MTGGSKRGREWHLQIYAPGEDYHRLNVCSSTDKGHVLRRMRELMASNGRTPHDYFVARYNWRSVGR